MTPLKGLEGPSYRGFPTDFPEEPAIAKTCALVKHGRKKTPVIQREVAAMAREISDYPIDEALGRGLGVGAEEALMSRAQEEGTGRKENGPRRGR